MYKLDLRATKQRAIRENGAEKVLRHYGHYEKMDIKGDQARGPSPLDKSRVDGLSVNLQKCVFNVIGGRTCGPDGIEASGDIYGLVQVFEYARTGKKCELVNAGEGLIEILDIAKEVSEKCDNVLTSQPALSERDLNSFSNDIASESQSLPNDNVPFGKRLKGLSSKNLVSKGVNYFENKGITDETIKAFGAGVCYRGYHKGRIVFPILRRFDDKNEVMAYISRAIDESQTPVWKSPVRFHPSYELGFHPDLFATEIQVLIKQKGLIIVKGYPDLMALYQAGFPNTVATFAESVSDVQIQRLVETGARAVKLFYNRPLSRHDENLRRVSLGKLTRAFWLTTGQK
ncbi:MAG: hypothetical protein AAFQ83_22990 [Bacteroidota bacterium]